MFDSVQPFRLVQCNRNRLQLGSWEREWIYKFFLLSASSRRKYLVEVRRYPGHLYTVDFYAKVHNVHRYRLRTNQFAAGKLGATVLAIIAGVIRQDPHACFGFIAAALLNETSDQNTKRFRLYTYMLEQKVSPKRYKIIANPLNSTIFMLPVALSAQPDFPDRYILRYDSIFQETF